MLSNCGAGEDSWDPLESKPVILKRHQPWILLGRTDAEAEAPIFWPPDANSWLTVKDPDARKDWRQKEKRVTEDEIVGWHHRFNGDELGQTLGDGDGQGSLACCSPWGHEELDMTERLNWSESLYNRALKEKSLDPNVWHCTVICWGSCNLYNEAALVSGQRLPSLWRLSQQAGTPVQSWTVLPPTTTQRLIRLSVRLQVQTDRSKHPLTTFIFYNMS